MATVRKASPVCEEKRDSTKKQKQTPTNNKKEQRPPSPGGTKLVHNFKYNSEHLHDDLENGKKCGIYGGCNAAYWGLAAIRGNVDMAAHAKVRSKDEPYNPRLDKLLQNEYVRRRWKDIVTFDPAGMYAKHPTMSATTAHMQIPEIMDDLVADGDIVSKKDKSINIIKMAIDYVWNIPAFAERLGMDETAVREALYTYTGQPDVKDKNLNAYLPPVGGCTVYFFGDPYKLADPTTETAVRVHDSCCGSDVFGTDICTCRPYLVYSILAAVQCAQRGGVGVIVYFQKEGRSLGEVTKFRVYNARKAQEGGDRAEKYFFQTENIAGIRDARFQEMMPDVLLWLGIERIDWLLSMSSEKYDAITSMGIQVMQRVALPNKFVPANAHIEINAKVASGYHSGSVDASDVAGRLRQLTMIRERCTKVFDMAQQGKTAHFNIDMKKMDTVVDYVVDTTKKDYPDVTKVPYHSRWRHFDEKEVEETFQSWPCDDLEKVRRLIDMVTVSVLLDAGAGQDWAYTKHGKRISRSEGLAIASYDMFLDGLFSSDVAMPHRVNAHGLQAMTFKDFSKGFQVDEKLNPMVGVKGRFGLMKRLGEALKKHPEFFGQEVARPGNIVDYVMKQVKNNRVSIEVLWETIIVGLESIWQETLAGVRRGDVWVYSRMLEFGKPGSDLVPFHKLSQWLTYSLLEPFERLGVKFDKLNLLTGLAEYRNGGLFVDFGVLSVKDPKVLGHAFDVGSELMVEWRALTVILLDKCASAVRAKLGLTEEQLGLAKVLQGGTWAAGRAIAKEKRKDGGSPISVRSDGTVF